MEEVRTEKFVSPDQGRYGSVTGGFGIEYSWDMGNYKPKLDGTTSRPQEIGTQRSLDEFHQVDFSQFRTGVSLLSKT